MNQQNDIDQLSDLIARLPGLGGRSARRIVLQLLKKRETLLQPLIQQLQKTHDNIQECSVCGNLDTQSPCYICNDPRRESENICVVQDVADLWAMERSHAWRGLYHVLGGVMSAMAGTEPDDLRIPQLQERCQQGIDEVVLALNVTVEGQTTAHYIVQQLKDLPIKITRLAHGMPIGGELDYLDSGTLSTALNARLVV